MRRFLLLLLLLRATVAVAETAPRFLIESIRVVGLSRAPERVVISESRLQAGREYTEAELRSGAARVTRLPYIVRTELRLEKGGARGSYVLVIVATEAKPVFLGGLIRVRNDKSTTEGDNTDAFITAGSRLLLGRSGVLHGAATSGEDNILDVGYTHYDLFGRGAFIGGYLQYRKNEETFATLTTGDQITAQIIGGVALRGNHGLRASWTRTPATVDLGTPTQPSYVSDHFTVTELAWIYDSTDDATIPTSGSRIVVSANSRRGPFIDFTNGAPVLDHYRGPGALVRASRLVELRPRHSIGGAASFARSESAVFSGATGGTPSIAETWQIDAVHEYTLWQRDLPWRIGDVQLETGLRYFDSESHAHLLGRTRRTALRTTRARFGVIVRNEWAVIRINIDLATAKDEQ
jgi:hypothetical protein